jgi:hypothetical protein
VVVDSTATTDMHTDDIGVQSLQGPFHRVTGGCAVKPPGVLQEPFVYWSLTFWVVFDVWPGVGVAGQKQEHQKIAGSWKPESRDPRASAL